MRDFIRVTDVLAKRKQRVRVNNTFSNWQETINGIPQGLTMGPLLFVIFINVLPDVIKNSYYLICGWHDSSILFTPKKTATTYISTQSRWTDTSLLKFHPDKCCHMRIGHSPTRNDGYTMGSNQATPAKPERVKDIGITFDSSLKSVAYIYQKNNNIAKFMMGTIWHTFWKVTFTFT